MIEVAEINRFTFPKDRFAIKIKFRELKTDKENQGLFLIENDEGNLVKRGGKYALIYERYYHDKLKSIGVEYKLLKVYELK